MASPMDMLVPCKDSKVGEITIFHSNIRTFLSNTLTILSNIPTTLLNTPGLLEHIRDPVGYIRLCRLFVFLSSFISHEQSRIRNLQYRGSCLYLHGEMRRHQFSKYWLSSL